MYLQAASSTNFDLNISVGILFVMYNVFPESYIQFLYFYYDKSEEQIRIFRLVLMPHTQHFLSTVCLTNYCIGHITLQLLVCLP